MRGRPCTQPFLVEKGRLSSVAPAGFFSCPVGQPGRPLIRHLRCQLPPKGKPLGCAALYEKSAPNQGTYMGSEIAQRPFRCASNAKTSEWKRAGYKRRGSRGQRPRRSFFRLSLEKAGLPPGVGREPTWQGLPCNGSNRAPPWTRVFMAARSHSLVFGMVVPDPFEGLFPPVC